MEESQQLEREYVKNKNKVGGMMTNREFTVIVEKGEDGYFIGTVLELKGCHTQGENMYELMKNVKEAIELYLEVETYSKPYISNIVGIQKVTV